MMSFLGTPQYLAFTLVAVIGVLMWAYMECKIRQISRSEPLIGRKDDIPEVETADWWRALRQKFLRGWILSLIALGISAVMRGAVS